MCCFGYDYGLNIYFSRNFLILISWKQVDLKKKIFFSHICVCLKGGREKTSSCWSSPQIATTSRVGLVQNQEWGQVSSEPPVSGSTQEARLSSSPVWAPAAGWRAWLFLLCSEVIQKWRSQKWLHVSCFVVIREILVCVSVHF